MIFITLVALGLASGALAGPYKRFDGLTVKLSGPATSVSSVDELILTASVANSGAESVKILKYGTILDSELPTKSFKVTKDGEAVAFTGLKLSVSLSEVDDTAFAVVPAGETVTVTHKVASLFDFAAAGAGKYSFEPITTFQVQGAVERVSASELSKVEATANTLEVEISGDLAKRELPQLNKRAVDICTTSSRKSVHLAFTWWVAQLSASSLSYTEGKALASGAVSYISSHGADSLYTAYFGATATSRVSSILSAVANENSSSRTIFFNEVATTSLCSGTTVASRNIRGGTTLHELTHAVGNTDDVTYGCSADQALSDANSVINADNYNCFTTQIYANTKC
ncbi:hypothetical protein DXG01_001794 [Tephrocybe rancida]|nr:hypothetical protein DXG01_001794 [Tephrocybe rancida]